MLNPASRIIRSLGGHDQVAKATGVSISRVYRWTYPKSRGGTGGLVPQKHHPAILALAQGIGLKFTADEFLQDIGYPDYAASQDKAA